MPITVVLDEQQGANNFRAICGRLGLVWVSTEAI